MDNDTLSKLMQEYLAACEVECVARAAWRANENTDTWETWKTALELRLMARDAFDAALEEAKNDTPN